MNKRQFMRHDMILRVYDACLQYKHAWEDHRGFCDALEKLETPIRKMKRAMVVQGYKTNGITRAKTKAREELVDLLMFLAGGVFAYAHNKEEVELMSCAKLSRSSMLKIRDVAVVPICRGFYEIIMERVGTDPALENYGVTLLRLNLFKEKMENYDEYISLPRQAIGYRANATSMIDEQIRNALTIIENELDKLVIQFKGIEGDFYSIYKRGRKQIGGRQKQKEKEKESGIQREEQFESGMLPEGIRFDSIETTALEDELDWKEILASEEMLSAVA